MEVSSAEFLISNTAIEKLPADTLPEFAFIGRSNVGKSSLLNMLTKIKGLAKTSSTPGKTQTINHFLINKSWYLVDLPGYGFAKVSREKRADWEQMIMQYLTRRKNLMAIFVLVDIRVPPQKSDLEMINKLGGKNLAVSVIFTKTDKLNKTKVNNQLKAFNTALLEYWEELPTEFITSAETANGRKEVLDYIEKAIPLFEKP
ncbi:MAG: ribosome biogenesis GTP-binding protein YihA/YsxC [Bacteroidota bacterium]